VLFGILWKETAMSLFRVAALASWSAIGWWLAEQLLWLRKPKVLHAVRWPAVIVGRLLGSHLGINETATAVWNARVLASALFAILNSRVLLVYFLQTKYVSCQHLVLPWNEPQTSSLT
jgi:hypothetical protein